jgi:hypothetical protein
MQAGKRTFWRKVLQATNYLREKAQRRCKHVAGLLFVTRKQGEEGSKKKA